MELYSIIGGGFYTEVIGLKNASEKVIEFIIMGATEVIVRKK